MLHCPHLRLSSLQAAVKGAVGRHQASPQHPLLWAEQTRGPQQSSATSHTPCLPDPSPPSWLSFELLDSFISFFFYCGAKNCTQHSRCGCSSPAPLCSHLHWIGKTYRRCKLYGTKQSSLKVLWLEGWDSWYSLCWEVSCGKWGRVWLHDVGIPCAIATARSTAFVFCWTSIVLCGVTQYRRPNSWMEELCCVDLDWAI